MRTKQLLWTVALPALFAACTSEDVFDAGAEVSALAGRPVVGNVEFTLDDADTRISADEVSAIYDWEEGDAYGVCLVDNYTGGKDSDAKKNYKLSSYIQTNYEWRYNVSNKTWKGDAALVEGNYLLYAPYNKNNYSRNPLQVVTPSEQTLDLNEDGTVDKWSAVRNVIKKGDTPFFINYIFLKNGDLGTGKNVSAGLFKAIFATPNITLTNNKNEEVTVTKIALETELEFPLKADIYVKEGETASASAAGAIGKLYREDWSTEAKKDGKSLNGTWNQDAKKVKLTLSTNDLFESGKPATSNVIVVNVNGELTIPAKGSVTFNVVMPGVQTGVIKVYAYTGSSTGYTIELDNTIKATTLIPHQNYPAQEFEANGTVKTTKGSVLNAKIKAGQEEKAISLDEIPVVVSSQNEFIAAIRNNNGRMTVIPTDKITIDSEILSLMAQVTNQALRIKGDVTIKGNTAAAAKDGMKVGETIVVTGTATIEGNVILGTTSNPDKTTGKRSSNVQIEGDIVVAEGATLTNGAVGIVDTSTAALEDDDMNSWEKAARINVENNGTIASSSTPLYVTNKATGTVTYADPIEVDAASEGDIYTSSKSLPAELKGNWTITGNVSTAAKTTTNTKGTVIPKDCTLTIASTGSLAGDLYVSAGATVDVNGGLDAATVMAGYKGERKDDNSGWKEGKEPLAAKINLYSGSTLYKAISTEEAYSSTALDDAQWYNLVEINQNAKKFGTINWTPNCRPTCRVNIDTIDKDFVKNYGSSDALALANTLTCTNMSLDPSSANIDLALENITEYVVYNNVKVAKADGKKVTLYNAPETGAASHVASMYVVNNMEIEGDFVMRSIHNLTVGGTLRIDAAVDEVMRTLYAKKIVVGTNHNWTSKYLTSVDAYDIEIDAMTDWSKCNNFTMTLWGGTVRLGGQLTLGNKGTNNYALIVAGDTWLRGGRLQSHANSATLIADDATFTIESGATFAAGASGGTGTISRAAWTTSTATGRVIVYGTLSSASVYVGTETTTTQPIDWITLPATLEWDSPASGYQDVQEKS